MKNIYLIFLLLTLAGCTDCERAELYGYTIKNESGKTITIKSYHSHSPSVSPLVTIINNGEELTKTYRDPLPPTVYDYNHFFGERGNSRDSLRIIYNNSKIQIFKGECSKNARNPLNTCIYNNAEEIFIFTEEDYQNAEDCNGNCE